MASTFLLSLPAVVVLLLLVLSSAPPLAFASEPLNPEGN